MEIKKYGAWELNSRGLEWSPVAGSFEYKNKPSGAIKGPEFLDHLSHIGLSKTLLRGFLRNVESFRVSILSPS
jgi:hypothetical protein